MTTTPIWRRRSAAIAAAGALIASAAILIPSSAIAAGPPPNDDFANAQVITGAAGSAVGYANNQQATVQPGEGMPTDHHPHQTVWFSWTAPAAGPVLISTAGSAFDTVEAVYTLSGRTLVSAGTDDDYHDSTSAVPVVAVAGTTYFVQVGGYSLGEGGVLQVAIDPITIGITGVVKTGSGTPVAGACVTDTGNPGDSAITNPAGQYVIAQAAGTDTPSASNCLGTANITTTANAPSLTTISTGVATSPAIVATTGGGLTGRVIDQSGAPVGGAYVGVSGSGLSSVTAMTDAAGRYSVSGLVAGSYTIEAYDNNYNLFDDTLASTVPVSGSATAAAPDLTVHEMAGIDGHVTKSDGTNYGSACITFTSGATSTHVNANSSGNYSAVLPAGTYQVSFNDNCVSPLTYIWFNGATSAATATPVVLSAGVELSGVSGNFQGGATAVPAPTRSVNSSPFISPVCVTDRAAAAGTASALAAANATSAAAQSALVKATAVVKKLEKQLKKAKKKHKPTARLIKKLKQAKKTLALDKVAQSKAASAASAAASAASAASAAVAGAC